MLIDDRRLGPCAAEGRSLRKDQLEILVRFFVPENPLGDLEQATEFNQGGNTSANRRLEYLFAHPAESERAKTCLVCDAEQIITLRQSPDGAALAFAETPFGSLHQAAAPHGPDVGVCASSE